MNQIMQIQNQEIQVKEFNGQRVVTLKDIDLVHERKEGAAKWNFNHNKQHFVDGEDFYLVKPSDFQKCEIHTLGFQLPNRGLTLITESGYLMLVKSFTDDLAWKVQRQLVNCYFKVKEACDGFTFTEQKMLSDEERIKIGEVITSCSQYNLKLLIDIYRPYLSAEIISEYLSASRVTEVEVRGNLAEQLSQYIKENDLTQKEFSKRAQLPKSAVSMYCNGKTKNPTAKNMKKITMVMSCEL